MKFIMFAVIALNALLVGVQSEPTPPAVPSAITYTGPTINGPI